MKTLWMSRPLRIVLYLWLCSACSEDKPSGAQPPAPDSGVSGSGGSAGRGGSGGAAGSAGAAGTGGQANCPRLSQDGGAAENGIVVIHEVDIFGVDFVGVSGGHAYFVDDGELQRVPVSGGSAEVVGPMTSRPTIGSGNQLFWFERSVGDAGNAGDAGDGGTAYRLVKAPLDNPASITVVADNLPSIDGGFSDATHMYWSTRSPANIHRVSLAGGAPEVFVPGGQPLGTLLHDGYLWWLDFQSNSLERIPLAGGTRERLVEVHFGGPMAGDADAVYWGDTSLNTIEKWSPATGRVRLSDADPNGIIVADGTIYWTNGFIGGSVRSVRTDGSNHRTLLCGLSSPGWIIVEGSYLIVSSDDGILRLNR